MGMPVYTYSALNERGKMTKGVISADSPRSARGKLRQAGLFATDILETGGAESHDGRNLSGFSLLQRVRAQDLTVMTRQFATLMAANLTVVEALTALIEQTDNRLLQKTLIEVRESLNEGSSLAVALEQHPKVFSDLFVNMARAGETSGTLDAVMLRLADLTERQLDTRNQITAKMYYPLFMLVIGGLVLMALLAYVVPTVTAIFSHMNATLPLPTRILIAVSDFLKAYWWAMGLAALGLILAVQRYRRTRRGARRFDLLKIRAPLVGKLALRMAMSRFTRTLGMLRHSDIPLLDALEIARAVVNNTVLSDAIQRAQEEIREGATIAAPLQASGYFPPLVSHMISVGEKTGRLEEMLLRVADNYDNEVRSSIEGLTSLVEPVIIVLMAVVVFAIMLAVLLPIFELNTTIR
jgi:general secretion pathway protein F